MAGAAFTYDANRNLTFDGTNMLAYDVENRLISAGNASNTATYTYDALGHGKAETVNTKPVTNVLDGGDEILDTSGNNAKPNVMTMRGAGGEPVASIKVSNGASPEVQAKVKAAGGG